jgi:hypothetical protein
MRAVRSIRRVQLKASLALIFCLGIFISNEIHSPRQAITNEGVPVIMIDRSFGKPWNWNWNDERR